MSTLAIARLTALPRSERREALQSIVVEAFKTALLMTDDEELPVDANYFDFGLSSLRVVEVKQRLETELGCSIDAALLFSSPTVQMLMEHLTAGALEELFAERAAEAKTAAAPMRPLGGSLLPPLDEA
jgi:acyl carrier protein